MCYFEIDALMDQALQQGVRGVDETVRNVTVTAIIRTNSIVHYL